MNPDCTNECCIDWTYERGYDNKLGVISQDASLEAQPSVDSVKT